MKFTVIAVGKLKERFWSDACSEYLKRLQPYAKTKVVEIADVDPARAGGEAASIEREGTSILKAIPERAHMVLLAIDGKQRSSEMTWGSAVWARSFSSSVVRAVLAPT